jgi:hypothetical protein
VCPNFALYARKSYAVRNIKVMSEMITKSIDTDSMFEVIISGGLGNQVLSLIIYYGLRSLGIEAIVNTSYFQKQQHIANQGTPGAMSHWGWQLDRLGHKLDSLERVRSEKKRLLLVPDGALKLELVRQLYQLPSIKDVFCESNFDLTSREWETVGKCKESIVAHVRRGDYCNVASKLQPLDETAQLITRCRRLAPNLVIFTDDDTGAVASHLSAVGMQFDNFSVIDDCSPESAFAAMLSARLLITSNSQFSFAASLLRADLSIASKNWYGKGNAELEGLDAKILEFAAAMVV